MKELVCIFLCIVLVLLIIIPFLGYYKEMQRMREEETRMVNEIGDRINELNNIIKKQNECI